MPKAETAHIFPLKYTIWTRLSCIERRGDRINLEEDIAQALGVSRYHFRKYARLRHGQPQAFTTDQLLAIADRMGVEVQELLTPIPTELQEAKDA